MACGRTSHTRNCICLLSECTANADQNVMWIVMMWFDSGLLGGVYLVGQILQHLLHKRFHCCWWCSQHSCEKINSTNSWNCLPSTGDLFDQREVINPDYQSKMRTYIFIYLWEREREKMCLGETTFVTFSISFRVATMVDVVAEGLLKVCSSAQHADSSQATRWRSMCSVISLKQRRVSRNASISFVWSVRIQCGTHPLALWIREEFMTVWRRFWSK